MPKNTFRRAQMLTTRDFETPQNPSHRIPRNTSIAIWIENAYRSGEITLDQERELIRLFEDGDESEGMHQIGILALRRKTATNVDLNLNQNKD